MSNLNLFVALRAAFPTDLDAIAVETADPGGPGLCYSWRDLDRATAMMANLLARSEERRVGKECSLPCRSRWSPYH